MAEDGQSAPRWINGVEPTKKLLSLNGTQILELECRQQPERLRELLHAYHNDPTIRSELASFRLLAAAPGPILFIGMGASFCTCVTAAIHLQSHGRLALAVDAGEWLTYAEPVWGNAGLSVLLTTSGESAELVELFKRSKNPRGLICNNPISTCWKLAEHKLPILAGPEYGNCTKTYTNSTAAAIILGSEILGVPWQQEAEHACEVVSRNVESLFARRSELEEFCRGVANIEIVGRGAGYGAAFMSALCIREMSGFRAAPHTGAGFRHGPNLDVDGTHLAIIFALGRVAALGGKLSNECIRRGGRVLFVSSEDQPRADRFYPVKLDRVAEPWEAITPVLVAQALTLAMVERSGCRLPPRFQYGMMEQ